MQIQWREGTNRELEAATYFLRMALPDVMPSDDFLDLRCTVLDFYPQLVFVEITDNETSPPRQLYALLDPDAAEMRDGVTVLDMTNAPVYGLNDKWLSLNRDNVTKYAAFFFSCVAGPYGLMPMIERLELPAGQEPNEETKEALEQINDCVPPRILAGGDDEDWRLAAALLFQGAVFRTEILIVDKTGHVRVDKHELALASGDPDSAADDDEDTSNDNEDEDDNQPEMTP